MTNPFADVQRIERGTRRVRLPIPLLLSQHHSPLAVAAYGLLDVMGSPERPVEAGRRWLAARLDCSVDGLAKALRALSREHVSDDPLVPDSPRWLMTARRGNQRTAQRATVAGVPYVDVPMWTLDHGAAPDTRAWRYYALLLHLRRREHGTVALPRRELAAIARVREDSLPVLDRQLEAAGLLVTCARPGRTTVLLPVTVPLADKMLDDLRTRLDHYTQAVHNPCSAAFTERAGEHPPTPSAGTAPHPRAGTSPTPSEGTSTRDPLYADPHDEDPAPARAFAPSAHALADDGHGDLASLRSPAARGIPWCGYCPGPGRRIETDPDTGRPTGRACPRCGGERRAA